MRQRGDNRADFGIGAGRDLRFTLSSQRHQLVGLVRHDEPQRIEGVERNGVLLHEVPDAMAHHTSPHPPARRAHDHLGVLAQQALLLRDGQSAHQTGDPAAHSRLLHSLHSTALAQPRQHAQRLQRQLARRRNHHRAHLPFRVLPRGTLQQPVHQRHAERQRLTAASGRRAEHVLPAASRVDALLLDDGGLVAVQGGEVGEQGGMEGKVRPRLGAVEESGLLGAGNRGDFVAELFLLLLAPEGEIEGDCALALLLGRGGARLLPRLLVPRSELSEANGR